MAFYKKKPTEIKFKDFQKLPEDQKEWLLKAAGLSPDEDDLEENINDNMHILYLKGDYTEKQFVMDAAFVIIDGSIKSEHVDTFDTVLLVTQDITTDNFATGNESVEVWGNVIVKSKLIFGDVTTTFTVKNKLTANTIINTLPDETDLELSVGGGISGVKKVYVAENSYGQMGNTDILHKLGFDNVEEMDSEEWEEITSELY